MQTRERNLVAQNYCTLSSTGVSKRFCPRAASAIKYQVGGREHNRDPDRKEVKQKCCLSLLIKWYFIQLLLNMTYKQAVDLDRIRVKLPTCRVPKDCRAGTGSCSRLPRITLCFLKKWSCRTFFCTSMGICINSFNHANYFVWLHWRFFKKIQWWRGQRGLNLPSILEETGVLYRYEHLSITRVLHESRCTRKSRLKQKSDFLIKRSFIWPCFHYFCREFNDSKAPGGTLPLALPIAATVWLSIEFCAPLWITSWNLLSWMK